MSTYFYMKKLQINKIYQGDTLKVLKTFPDECVDMVITSPPYYGLRDYGDPEQIGLEKTFEEYIVKLLAITEQLKRVLKKDGTLWWNHGDSYNAGRDGGHPGGKKQWKPDQQKFQGKSGVNIKGMNPKCMLMQPYRLALRMIDEQQWILRNQIIWHKPNCMPSSATDRFTVDFEPMFFFVKNKKYYFDTQYEQFNSNDYDKARMKGGRVEYKGKWDNDTTNPIQGQRGFCAGSQKGRIKRTTWKITTVSYKDAHFAVYPPALIETPIKAGCPEKSIVLDPFFGSGTTGIVAQQLGRKWVGIELNPEYIKLAEDRFKQTQLF